MAVTIDNIPVYQALVDESDTGMLRISLVDRPAVMSDFQKFSEDSLAVLYRIQDEDRRLVRGVVMRADFPIYRKHEKVGEYYIIYRPDTIRVMAEKYLVESRQNNVNLMHEEGSDVEGVQMVQYFIKDSEAGVSPQGFDEIADGSLFAEFHVVNDEVWDEVKAGTYRGFSLEGVFNLVPENDEGLVRGIVDRLDGKFNSNRNIMGKLKNIVREFMTAAKVLEELGNVTTDKGVLSWDGDEDIKAGDAVYKEDSEGNRTPAEEGDYKTGDGKVIRVADGKVTEITDADNGDDSSEGQDENGKDALMRAMKEAMSLSYSDKTRAIADAIAESGKAFYFWIEEAGDDFAIICTLDDDSGSRHLRFTVSWDGEKAVIGDSQEVRLAFVPVGQEIVFKSEKDALEAENVKLKSELEELRKTPAGRPAHEEFKGGGTSEKTGIRGIDRLSEIARA